MRHLKAFAFVVAIILVACATRPVELVTYPVSRPDSIRIMLSEDAKRSIERLAKLTLKTRAEQAACVESFGVLPTARHSWVVAIMEIGPSNPYDSDSLKVWTRNQKPFCGEGVPNIHTHIVPNEVWGRPSDYDITHAREYPHVPFRVVVSVSQKGPHRVTIYGLR